MKPYYQSIACLVVLWITTMASPCPAAPAPVAQRSGPRTEVIGDFEKGTDDWRLSLGKEYPGAKGDSRQDATTVHSGKASLRLSGDFSAGGRYVAIERKLDPALELAALRFWVKAESLTSMTLRLTDATGQTHQQDIKLEPKPDWQEIMTRRFTGPISWGGVGDKQWHGPATAISLMVEAAGVTAGSKAGTLWLDDLTADITGSVSQAALAQAAAEAQPPKVDTTLEIGRPLPYFWGKQDAPPAKAVLVVNSDAPRGTAVTAVRLLNYKEEVLAELWKGDGIAHAEKPFRQEISLPVSLKKGDRVLTITNAFVTGVRHGAKDDLTVVDRELRKRGLRVDHRVNADIKELREIQHRYKVIFMNFNVPPRYGTTRLQFPAANALWDCVWAGHPCVVFTSFRNPFAIYELPYAHNMMLTFSNTAGSQAAAVKVWLGEEKALGKCPVELPGYFQCQV